MPYVVPLPQVQADYPEYTVIGALTPSEQKAAFHVQDAQGQDLCLKIISPNYNMDRLSREILALQAIRHPNVAAFREYTFSTRQGQHWPRTRAATFFSALCDGLEALASKSIVHRDLKPSNIRVRTDDSPVIIDLGLARHLSLSDLTNTSDGAAIGTPLYFAPEQFRGTKHDIDHRTDLFAVGIMLYQALTGRHPFWVPTLRRPLPDVVCDSQDHLSTAEFMALPDQWKLIVGRLLEKERAKRPTNAAQVAAILRRIEGA